VLPTQQTDEVRNFYWNKLNVSQTHGAFVNLIEGNVDIILTHRTLSTDEQQLANQLDVALVEVPIASDAFVFVVNKNNPVGNLSQQQVRQIYNGEITNWKQVGGYDADIQPYTRPRNSGSEEIMQQIVMGELTMADFPEIYRIATMAGVFTELRNDPNSICYTFNFYKDKMVRIDDTDVPKLSIDNVFPDETTVKNNTYPFISYVHVAIRNNLDHNSTAYQLFQWLQTTHANDVIKESGYIPINTSQQSITPTTQPTIQITPNPTNDIFYVHGLNHPTTLTIYNVAGQQVLHTTVTDKQPVNVKCLHKGVYIVNINNTNAKLIIW
jgi:phosphate transport system substrate-binding protein